MDSSIIFDPLFLAEKVGARAARLRRLRRLAGTPAAALSEGHIGSISLLDLIVARRLPVIVFDVGAFVGTWTLLLKSILPSSIVYAFEPLPSHSRRFENHVAQLSGVHLHECALGARRCSKTMRITNLSDASSFLELTNKAKTTYGLNEVETINVAIETIDSLVEAGSVQPPDLIKLDVQGFEIEVLRGAKIALSKCSWVNCEVSFEEYYADQPLFHDVADLMNGLGFRVYAFGHQTPLGAPVTQADVLFGKKQF